MEPTGIFVVTPNEGTELTQQELEDLQQELRDFLKNGDGGEPLVVSGAKIQYIPREVDVEDEREIYYEDFAFTLPTFENITPDDIEVLEFLKETVQMHISIIDTKIREFRIRKKMEDLIRDYEKLQREYND